MKFPVLLEPVAVVDQAVQMFVDIFKGRASRNALPGRIRRKSVLPYLVQAFYLSLRMNQLKM